MEKKTLPVGLQLYSVRDFLEKDFRATMEKVKEIGYDYAELGGLYGETPESIKKIADDVGIKIISAHIGYDEMLGDPEGTAETYKAVGCKFIAIPFLDEKTRPGAPDFDTVLKNINRIGGIFADKGIILLYHNHDFEFITMPNGQFGLDYMYSQVPERHLKTELDVCWVKVAGQDPAEYIRKYTGRSPVVHLKDYKGQKTENMYGLLGTDKKAVAGAEFRFQPLGDGVQDIPAILEASVKAGAEYVIVEQDSSLECPSIDAVAKSRRYLKSLGW
ncbi:MAG: sugar phosphate isomerase/epimerase [Clostridiales bacterium]|jgi:sugar phosphate isomerase/epimerase|nr:sugar phosphate isomerase/epimerase [Clostridiales bacterium]